MLTVTAAELTSALARYDAEAVPGSLRTPRYRLRYTTWADGPRTLVIAHGMCDLARSFAVLTAHLAGEFRCVGYEVADGRGDGANLGAYRHSDFAHDLIALLDHLGIERADVLGSSFGSSIAMRTAWLYPDRVRRVVLQGGFARRPLLRIERGLSRVGRYWPWRMGDLPIRDTAMRRLEAEAFASAPPEVFDHLIANSGRTPVRAAARRTLIIDKLDLRPLLPHIRHPVLMVGGDRDRIVPRRYEAEVEAGLPDVRRVEFSPCGHYPQYTHPGPMADAVRRFLNEPDGPATSRSA
jgi:pimeloyl-ACP methyl ester carboxylesterase